MYFVFVLIIDIRLDSIPHPTANQAPKQIQNSLMEDQFKALTQIKNSQFAEITQVRWQRSTQIIPP